MPPNRFVLRSTKLFGQGRYIFGQPICRTLCKSLNSILTICPGLVDTRTDTEYAVQEIQEATMQLQLFKRKLESHARSNKRRNERSTETKIKHIFTPSCRAYIGDVMVTQLYFSQDCSRERVFTPSTRGTVANPFALPICLVRA